MKDRNRYGVIDESHITLSSPRMCDDAADLLEDAFTAAFKQIELGATEVAIVNARYSHDDGCFYEVVDGRGIYIDASNWEFKDEED